MNQIKWLSLKIKIELWHYQSLPPVLTGEGAEEFERHAQETYNAVLNRTDAQKKEAAHRYEQGIKLVRKMLAKSRLPK